MTSLDKAQRSVWAVCPKSGWPSLGTWNQPQWQQYFLQNKQVATVNLISCVMDQGSYNPKAAFLSWYQQL